MEWPASGSRAADAAVFSSAAASTRLPPLLRRGRRPGMGLRLPSLPLMAVMTLLLSLLLAPLGGPHAVAAASGEGQDRPPPSSSSSLEEQERAAVVDLELDAWGDAMALDDKAATLSGPSSAPEGRFFPLPGEEGNFEMYKGWRDISAAENFTPMDYLSIRGAVLALTPDDTDPTTFPMCELFKIGAPLRLHCVMIAVTMRSACPRVYDKLPAYLPACRVSAGHMCTPTHFITPNDTQSTHHNLHT